MPREPAHPLDEAARRFRGFLHANDLRLTAERMDLLRAVLHAPPHFDADQLTIRMRRKKKRGSRATTYRTLNLLERCGIVRKSMLGKNRAVYETCIGRRHHDHIICVSCGKIEEFRADEIERLQERIAQHHGYRIIDHVHQILGLCSDCRNGESAAREKQ